MNSSWECQRRKSANTQSSFFVPTIKIGFMMWSYLCQRVRITTERVAHKQENNPLVPQPQPEYLFTFLTHLSPSSEHKSPEQQGGKLFGVYQGWGEKLPGQKKNHFEWARKGWEQILPSVHHVSESTSTVMWSQPLGVCGRHLIPFLSWTLWNRHPCTFIHPSNHFWVPFMLKGLPVQLNGSCQLHGSSSDGQ